MNAIGFLEFWPLPLEQQNNKIRLNSFVNKICKVSEESRFNVLLTVVLIYCNILKLWRFKVWKVSMGLYGGSHVEGQVNAHKSIFFSHISQCKM